MDVGCRPNGGSWNDVLFLFDALFILTLDIAAAGVGSDDEDAS